MSSERAGNEARFGASAAGFADRFAETSFKGAVTRAALACVLITPVVAAAKIWLSPAAAVVVCLVAVTVYCVVAVRFRRRHRQPSVS